MKYWGKRIPVEERTAEDWKHILKEKTTANFLVGLFLGCGFMIGILALAYLF